MRTTRASRALAAWVLMLSLCVGVAACGDDNSPAPDETGATGQEPGPQEDTAAAGEEAATLDVARVEAALEKTLDGTELLGAPTTFFPEGGGAPEQGQIGGGRLDVRSVTCPGDVPVEKGEKFTCTVDGNQDGSVQVTQLDASGGRAGYKAKFDFKRFGVETTVEGKTSLE